MLSLVLFDTRVCGQTVTYLRSNNLGESCGQAYNNILFFSEKGIEMREYSLVMKINLIDNQ